MRLIILAWLVFVAPVLVAADVGKISDGLRQAITATALVRAAGGRVAGTGSAFVIQRSPGRLVLATNWHVVEPALGGSGGAIEVVFFSGTARETVQQAIVLGGAPGRDLALIACDGFPQAPAALPVPPTPVPVSPGDPLVTVGFPLGDSLSVRILSSPETTISQAVAGPVLHHAYGQRCCLTLVGGVNPGNSGGPLVTRDGKLLGVCSAGFIQARIGDAIPAQELITLQNGDAVAMSITLDSTGTRSLDLAVQIADPFAKVEQAAMLLVPDTPEVAVPAVDRQGRIGALGGKPLQARLVRSADDRQRWTGRLRLDDRDAGVDVWIAQVRHGAAALTHGSILQRWRVRGGIDQHHDWLPGEPPWLRAADLPRLDGIAVWDPAARVDPQLIIQRRHPVDATGRQIPVRMPEATVTAVDQGIAGVVPQTTGVLERTAAIPVPGSATSVYASGVVQVTGTPLIGAVRMGLATVVGELSAGTPLLVTACDLVMDGDEPARIVIVAAGGITAPARIAACDPTTRIALLAVPQPPPGLQPIPLRSTLPRTTEPLTLIPAIGITASSTITAIRRDDVGQVQLLQISGVFDRTSHGAPALAADGLVGLLLARGTTKEAAGIDLLLPAGTIADLLAGAPTVIRLTAESRAEGLARITIAATIVDLSQRLSAIEALVAPFIDESSFPKSDAQGRLGKLPGRSQRVVLRRTGDQATGTIDVAMADMVYAPWLIQLRTATKGTMRSWSPMVMRVPFNGFATYQGDNLPK